MKAQELLETLDPLPFSRRQALLVKLALKLDPSELQDLLASLTGDLYQTQCALLLASVAKESDFLIRTLTCPWPLARRQAAKLLPAQTCEFSALLPALLETDMKTRKRLFVGIRRRHRSDLADPLIETVLEHFGPKEASLLLPALSETKWKEWAPKLARVMVSWRTSAGRYPDGMMDLIRLELQGQSLRQRTRVWYRFHGALEPLARLRPKELLLLANQYPAPRALWSLFVDLWGHLVSQDSTGVAQLLTSKPYQGLWKDKRLPQGLRARFRGLDNQTQTVLGKSQAGSLHHLESILASLPPSSREPFFQAATEDIDLSQLILSQSLLELLPHAHRAREAQRMLQLPQVQSSLEATANTLGFVPPKDNQSQLQALAKSPQVEVRTAAKKARVRSAGLYGSQIESVIRELGSLRSEADPVRLAVLETLKAWPYSRFRDEHIPALRSLLQDVCQARDSSDATRRAFQQMGLRFLTLAPLDGELFCFGEEVLRAIADTGTTPVYGQLPRYSRERREAIIRPLIERIDKDAKDDEFRTLFTLSAQLGDKCWEHPCVQERLGRLIDHSFDDVARRAVLYWLNHPRERAERVEKLLGKDLSYFVIPAVSTAVSEQRQDLLDPWLAAPPEGRFAKAHSRHVPYFRGCFHRWLPRQQEALAKIHQEIVEDESKVMAARALSAGTLGELCYLPDNSAKVYLDCSETRIRETALATIVCPATLLAKLNSEDARVAAYRLGRVLQETPRQEVAGFLSQGLASPAKITSQKELHRLLGKFRELSLLINSWQKEDLHRDVRVAALQALTGLLDMGSARECYLQAFDSDDIWIQRQALAVSPDFLPPSERQHWVEPLCQLVRRCPPSLSSLAWGRLTPWSVESPERVGRSALEQISDLDATGWRNALYTLMACGDSHPEILAEAATSLVEKDGIQMENRDLPARQRLRSLISTVAAEEELSARRRKLAQLRQVAMPESSLKTTLRVATEDWAPIASEVETFEEMEALLQAITKELQQTASTPQEILNKAQSLATEKSPSARRVSVELLSLAASKLGWNDSCQELLSRLRRDDYPGVAERAQLLVVRREL